jgi:hypothetical protein
MFSTSPIFALSLKFSIALVAIALIGTLFFLMYRKKINVSKVGMYVVNFFGGMLTCISMILILDALLGILVEFWGDNMLYLLYPADLVLIIIFFILGRRFKGNKNFIPLSIAFFVMSAALTIRLIYLVRILLAAWF